MKPVSPKKKKFHTCMLSFPKALGCFTESTDVFLCEGHSWSQCKVENGVHDPWRMS